MLRKTLNILKGILKVKATILTIIVLALVYSQTQFFKENIRTLLVNNAGLVINGTLEIERIEGNLFTRAELHGVRVATPRGPVLSLGKAVAQYNLLRLLFGDYSLSQVSLVDPVVTILRSRDSSWTLSNLFLYDPTDTSESDLEFSLNQINIENGTVVIHDSLAPPYPERDHPKVRYHQVRVGEFYLSGSFSLSPGFYKGQIKRLSFVEEQSGIEIVNMTADLELNNSAALIRELEINTNRSSASIRGSLRNISVLDIATYEEMGAATIEAEISAPLVDLDELKTFLPSGVDFLKDLAKTSVKVSGTYGDMAIDRLTLQAGTTSLTAYGAIKNLHRPKNLYLDIRAIDGVIDPTIAQTHLPGLEIPDFRELGPIDLAGSFIGEPWNFETALTARGEGGSFSGTVGLDMTTEQPVYTGDLTIRELDLAKVFANEVLSSNLNLHVTLRGSSFDPSQMRSLLRVKIDSSEFNDLPIRNSYLIADVAEATGRLTNRLEVGPTTIETGFKASFAPGEEALYEFSTVVNSLDLERVLGASRFESDLNFRLEGKSTSIDPLTGKTDLTLTMFRSRYNKWPINAFVAHAATNAPEEAERKLLFTSDFGAFEANGRFTVAGLFADAGIIFAELIEHYNHSFTALRPLRVSPDEGYHRTIIPHPLRRRVIDSTNASLTFDIKDLTLLGTALSMDVAGSLSGSLDLERNPQFTLMGGNSYVRALSLKGKDFTLEADTVSLSFEFTEDTQGQTHKAQTADLRSNGKSLHLNGIDFGNYAVFISGLGNEYSLRANATVNSTYSFFISGGLKINDDVVVADIQSISAGVGASLYSNHEPIDILMGSDGLLIENFRMLKGDAFIEAGGYFDPAGVSDIAFRASSVSIEEVQRFINRADEILTPFRGQLSMNGMFRGTFAAPIIKADAFVQGLELESNRLGDLTLGAEIMEKRLMVNGSLVDTIRHKKTDPIMIIGGIIPLTTGKEYGIAESGSMDLAVSLNDFQLAVIDPLIPALDRIRGAVNGTITLGGSPSRPELSGNLRLTQTRFLFEPLAMEFIASGGLVAAGDSVRLDGVMLRNVPEDRDDGRMEFRGGMRLSNFRPREINMQATGQLQVMKQTSPLPGQPVYGDLFIATRGTPISWKGNFDRSDVRGEISVRSASLVIPPARQPELIPSQEFEVYVIDDIHAEEASEEVVSSGTVAPKQINIRKEADLSRARSPQGKNLLETMDLDMSLYLDGNSRIRFVFNPATGEELSADISGQVNYTKEAEITRFVGEVKVSNQSFYTTFGKRFEASGTLLFTGDLLNPELNIRASYQGVLEVDSVNAKQVEVIMEITDRLQEPKTKISLKENNEVAQRPDVESDAISFILTGKYRDQLTAAEQTNFNATVIAGLTSSLLSGPINDFTRRQFGVSVDVLYYGGNFQESANVRLSGSVGDAVVRFGGRVLNDLNNANISVQLPMSSVLNSETYRNLILEAESKGDSFDSADSRRSNAVRLLYRIVF